MHRHRPKNLDFFVRIGWLDDPNGAIRNVCGKKGEGGIPTLPATTISGGGGGYGQGGYGQGGYGGAFQQWGAIYGLAVRVEDADSHGPIENAVVEATGLTSRSAVTSGQGIAILSFALPSEKLTISKDGYDTFSEPIAQSGLTPTAFQMITVDLHRSPKPEPPKR